MKRHISVRIVKVEACRVDADLSCIKGGGACQLREKVLAEAARTFVCFVLPSGTVVNPPVAGLSSLPTTEKTQPSWVPA